MTAIFLVIAGSIFAFDASGPPPVKTMEWTATVTSNIVIPEIDFSKGVPLSDALDFIMGIHSVAEEYRPSLQSRFGGKFDQSTLVHIKNKDITMLRVVSLIADEIGAQIIIEPGVIIIAPSSAKKAESVMVVPNKIRSANGQKKEENKPLIKLPIHMNELVLINGKIYKKVIITAAKQNEVIVRHEGGIARIPPEKLMFELHKKLGYTVKVDGKRLDIKVKTGMLYRDALIKKMLPDAIFIQYDGGLIYIEKSLLTAESLKAVEPVK